MKDHPDIQQIHFRPELKQFLNFFKKFFHQNVKYFQKNNLIALIYFFWQKKIPKEISIILITLFPRSAINNLVPEEEERYRIEFGL